MLLRRLAFRLAASSRRLGLVLGFASFARSAVASCLAMPPHTTPAPVVACVTDSSYTFQIAGTQLEYPQAAFQQQLVQAFQRWFASAGLAAPEQGQIEFWLAVPEDSPASTQARAVLTWDGGSVVGYLGIAPEHWALTNGTIGVLEAGASYPQSFGYTAGSLLIAAQSSADRAALARYLAGYGVTAPEVVDATWQQYHVAPLSESSTSSAILADPEHPHWVTQITPNAFFEWTAWRQRAFAFSFSNP